MKYICICAIAVSILSLIVCILCLCFQYPRAEQLNFDYAGIIVGIFSLLVTVLMAWQISTMIGIDKHIEDIANNEVGKAVKEMKKENGALQELSWWNSVNMQLLSKNYFAAFCMSVRGLNIASSKDGKEKYKKIIESCFGSCRDNLQTAGKQDLQELIDIITANINLWNDKSLIFNIIKDLDDYKNKR